MKYAAQTAYILEEGVHYIIEIVDQEVDDTPACGREELKHYVGIFMLMQL